jgi:hypothetical protein
MNLSDRVTIPPEVMARAVGEETVILDLASGTYYGLDQVGTRIWELMVEGKTLAEICDRMLDEYEVSREELERDTIRLAQELAEQGLIAAA